MRSDIVRKMKRSGSSHIARVRKKVHNLSANSGCQGWLEHLDLHNACFFPPPESVSEMFFPSSIGGKQV